MNVLHLLVSGGTGGIEVLMKNYASHSTHKNSFVFVWKAGEIADEMAQAGARVHITNAGKESVWTTLERIRKICLEEQADIVVSHNSAPLLKLALIYIKMTVPHIHVVAYAHANARDICEHTRKKGLPVRRAVHWMGFLAADGIVAISESVSNSLNDYLHISPKKITRIFNGTPVVSGLPGKKTDSGTELKLVYVGRLIPEKGVQQILHALAKVKNRIAFTLTVAGDGHYRQDLEMLTRELELEEHVRFLGLCRDVPSLLRESDVFVHLPVWEEGFGITAIEAMTAGLVCIVNNRGALPEIVQNGTSGLIVDAEDPDALGDALQYLVQAPRSVWEQLQSGARRRAEDFSVTTFARELDDYFQSFAK